MLVGLAGERTRRWITVGTLFKGKPRAHKFQAYWTLAPPGCAMAETHRTKKKNIGTSAGRLPLIDPFRVLSWNILSTVHTHHNSESHQSGRADGLETEEQQLARHTRVAGRLRAEVADVLLLQEVDKYFLPSDWSGGMLPCGVGLPGYVAFRNYQPEVGEGTAVLLRKGVFERSELATVRLRGHALRKKTGLVAFAQRVGSPRQRLGLASIHLAYGMPEQHMNMLRAVLFALTHGQAWTPRVHGAQLTDEDFAGVTTPAAQAAIIAGDFNTRDGPLARLESYLAEHGFVRLPLAENVPTALDSNMAYQVDKVIDHIFVRGLDPLALSEVGLLPRGGRGPYGEDAVDLDGSDHAWLSCAVSSPNL